MSPTDTREEALRLRALLLPTALRWVDPEGEGAREAALAERFALGEPPNGEERDRLNAASAEADNALLGGLGLDPPPRKRVDHLRHPLSGGVQPTPTVEVARAQWDGWLEVAEGDTADKLWWAVCNDAKDSPWISLPAHPALPDVPAWARRSLTLALFNASHTGEAALLQLHIGPVKRFIQAARRTHDLWLGSYLLAHLACKMVQAVVEAVGPAAVVFPFVGRLPLLRRWIQGETLSGDARLDLLRAVNPNKLLAIVTNDRADAVAQAAARAAQEAWLGFGVKVRLGLDLRIEACKPCKTPWNGFGEQMGAHLEFGAWIQPWPQDRDEVKRVLDAAEVEEALPRTLSSQGTQVGASYGLLFNSMHRALGAARATERPVHHHGDARPKCGQCGGREQMGPVENTRDFWRTLSQALQRTLRQALQESRSSTGDGPGAERHSLQLRAGEGLCAVCLTKRLAPELVLGDPEQLGLSWNKDRVLLRFPSVASIASAPFRWRFKPEDQKGEWASPLTGKEWLNFSAPGNQLPGLGALGHDWLDGTWFYDSTYEPAQLVRDYFDKPPSWQAEPVEDAEFKNKVKKAHTCFQKKRAALRDSRKTPKAKASTYLAVVKLDGDDFGQWITGRAEARPSLVDIVPTWLRAVAEDEYAVAEGAAKEYWAQWLGAAGTSPLKRPLSPALHGEISRRLALAGTDTVPRVVEHFGLGRMIFSGGDDMLALLPLETALSTVANLVDALRTPERLSGAVTFSGGVAIGHMRSPLTRLVRRANEGEGIAKQARRRFMELATQAHVRAAKALREAQEASESPDRRVSLEGTLRETRALAEGLKHTGWLHIELHPGSGDPISIVLPLRLPRTRGEPLDVLTLIEAMITTRNKSGDLLLSSAPAHTLQREAAQLAGAPEAFAAYLKAQIRHTAWFDARNECQGRLLTGLLELSHGLGRLVALHADPQAAIDDEVAPHTAITGLLLLVRFMDREIPCDTNKLLEKLRETLHPLSAEGAS